MMSRWPHFLYNANVKDSVFSSCVTFIWKYELSLVEWMINCSIWQLKHCDNPHLRVRLCEPLVITKGGQPFNIIRTHNNLAERVRLWLKSDSKTYVLNIITNEGKGLTCDQSHELANPRSMSTKQL